MRLQKRKQEFEEKGFVFDLYHYLWMEEDAQENKVTPPCVNIPDTIYYKFGEPRLWFFTDKTGRVKKRMKNKLTVDRIEDEFLARTPSCDIVAFFIWINSSSSGSSNSNAGSNGSSSNSNTNGNSNNNNPDESLNYRFEYFDAAAFTKFLHTKSYEKEGYLQQFIQPKGEHNSIIKSIWSPTVRFHEKYRNLQLINDTSLDIYQRVINIESAKNQCEITQLKGKCLPNKISELARSVAEHLMNVSSTKKTIRQLDFIFKIDAQDKLYLLFCQNISADQQTQETHQQEFSYSIPNYINVNKIQIARPLNLKKCMNCERLIDEESSYQIDLDTIIQAWDFDHIAEDQYLAEYEIDKNEKLLKKQREAKQLNPMEKRKDATFNSYSITKNYQVPGVLRRVFPNLEYNELLKNRDNAIFAVQKITLCEECYLKVMDSAHYGQSIKNLAKYVIKSSMHKNDDLVPLKNDRIFFHKFKSKALQNQNQQPYGQNSRRFDTSAENNNNSNTFKQNDSSSMLNQLDQRKPNQMNQRSKSSSQILSSESFASRNQHDLTSGPNLHSSISNVYLKMPQQSISKKMLKPLPLRTQENHQNRYSEHLDQTASDNMNALTIKTLESPKENHMLLAQTFTSGIKSTKSNQTLQTVGTTGFGLMVPPPLAASNNPINVLNSTIAITSKAKKPRNIAIDNYGISDKQLLKLSKHHPKEISNLFASTSTSHFLNLHTSKLTSRTPNQKIFSIDNHSATITNPKEWK